MHITMQIENIAKRQEAGFRKLRSKEIMIGFHVIL